MVNLYIAVGLPGSGKSTLYEMAYSNCKYISSDAIREEAFGDVNDQSHNNEVFNIMENRTIEALLNYESVYYDATNLSSKRRINFIKIIRQRCKQIADELEIICILVVPPLNIVKERNAARERKVPEYVIDRMIKSFEVPHWSEGFDDIYVFKSTGGENLWEMLNKLVEVPHDNPHHQLSLGYHMRAAKDYYQKECMIDFSRKIDPRVAKAALFHDIGKGYCKVFHNSKGEPTEEAHYYNHENVGAYFYLANSSGEDINDDMTNLYIANLIQHHMDYWKGEKYMEKISKRFGEVFIFDLDCLHRADLGAH